MKLENKAQIELWLSKGKNYEAIAELQNQLKSAKANKELLSVVINFARLRKLIQIKLTILFPITKRH
ncbi:MAG: hypothetical protein IPN76_01700 [Saprospiraceae bacterium]|nr:hypothetical protein [Saprospiraceae bacterium]